MKIDRTIVPQQILILLLLAVALNTLRIVIFHSNSFIYLFWNIFLAILPFIISSILLWYANKKKLIMPVLVVGGIIWLLLFPNAPYIVTDLIHIGQGKSMLVLYDTVLLFSSAWLGLMLGMYSLSHIHEIIKARFSPMVASITFVLIILFTSFGIYLGRFLRFNSWDVFINPVLFFNNIWKVFAQPKDHSEAYLFTALFAFFIFMSYRILKYKNQN